MSIKTILLIITLVAFTGFLVLVAVERENDLKKSVQGSSINVAKNQVIKKDAEIFFVPSIIDVSTPSSVLTSDIYLNSYSEEVSAVQIEMSFNPKILKDIAVSTPVNLFFFGKENEYTVSFRNVDYTTGRISYAVSLNENIPFKKGTGKIATISFVVQNGVKAPDNQSQIIFLEKTMVTSPFTKDSILKSYTPLVINLGQKINRPANSTSSAKLEM